MNSVPVTPEIYIEAREWCVEHFGSDHKDFATWRGLANNEIGGDFYFDNEADAMAFKLRLA